MCCILRLLCCCCCCCDSDDNKNQRTFHKTLERLPSKTMTMKEKNPNPAVIKASTASSVATNELTQIYIIPSLEYKTEIDVIKTHGFDVLNWSEKIGRGSYGNVYKALYIKDQTVVAVKVIETDNKKENNLKQPKNELFIMEKTSHPHIIQLFTHFIIKDSNRNRNQVFIFMRFAENKSLSEYVRQSKTPFSEPSAKLLFAQLVSAVQHMHSLGIAHRDLKMGNILLDKDMNALVSDFGLSQVLFKRLGKRSMECYKPVGTKPYMAPEILLLETNKVPYDPFSADIWALGVILWAAINRSYPFGDIPHKMIRQMIRFERYRSTLCRYYIPSQQLDDIIRRIFCFDREKRIKISELVNHSWIRDEIQLINDKIKSQQK